MRRLLQLLSGCALLAGTALLVLIGPASAGRGDTGSARAVRGAVPPLVASVLRQTLRGGAGGPPRTCSVAAPRCVTGCTIPVAERHSATPVQECEAARGSRPCMELIAQRRPVPGRSAQVPFCSPPSAAPLGGLRRSPARPHRH